MIFLKSNFSNMDIIYPRFRNMGIMHPCFSYVGIILIFIPIFIQPVHCRLKFNNN